MNLGEEEMVWEYDKKYRSYSNNRYGWVIMIAESPIQRKYCLWRLYKGSWVCVAKFKKLRNAQDVATLIRKG